jgi:hypothetical protein
LLGAVSWGRLQTLLEAAIYQADPDGAEQQAAAAAQERLVRLGRNSEPSEAEGPGIWLWRSPHGRLYLVNTSGTPLGDTPYAQGIWRAASPTGTTELMSCTGGRFPCQLTHGMPLLRGMIKLMPRFGRINENRRAQRGQEP